MRYMERKMFVAALAAFCFTCLVYAGVVKVYRNGRVVAAYKLEKVDSITVHREAVPAATPVAPDSAAAVRALPPLRR